MAYSKIKEENGSQAILINGWSSGIASDPYSGLGMMLTTNLSTIGEVSSGYTLTSNTLGTGTLNTPIHKAINQTNGVTTAYFILDSASQVWTSTTYNGTFSFLSSSNSTTGATATNQGLAYWNGYLFKFRNGSIDYLQGGSGSWVTGWDPTTGSATSNNTIVPSVPHNTLTPSDGFLYFCNGASIGTIILEPGYTSDTWSPTNPASFTFSAISTNHGDITVIANAGISAGNTSATLTAIWPYTSGTYPMIFSTGQIVSGTFTNASDNITWTPAATGSPTTTIFVTVPGIAALILPPYETAQCIAQQGSNVLIGGAFNAIYPWDGISPAFFTPIFIGDNSIDRMVTVNTNVYIFAGGATSRGRVYITNGSSVNLFFKIPDYLSGQQDPYYVWGDAMFHRNNLVFGFFMKQNAGGFVPTDSSFGSTSMVWAIDLSVNALGAPIESAFRSISQINSAGTSQASVLLPALQTSPGLGYIVGANGSGGATAASIQYSGTTAGIGRFTLYTDLIPVGTLFNKKTFTQVEFKLRSPLQSGESIAIIPIVDGVTGSQFMDNTVGDISNVFAVNFEQCQWLQFLVQGIGNSATSGVRLEEIRVR